MSLDTRGIDPRPPEAQRLLPQSLEDRLLKWLGRAAGILLLASVALTWASLVSWSVLDPSLTHATAAEPQNWLGAAGAILSDLILQTLGFAGVVAVLAPLLWSFDLLRDARVPNGRIKFSFYPLSILALAGALSAMPTFGAWPLHHSFAGALGDGLFKVVESIFAVVNAERARLASTLALTAAAATMLAKSTGFRIETAATEMKAVWRRRPNLSQWRERLDDAPEMPMRPAEPSFSRGFFERRTTPNEPRTPSGFHRDANARFAVGELHDPNETPREWSGEECAQEYVAYLRARNGASAGGEMLGGIRPGVFMAPDETAAAQPSIVLEPAVAGAGDDEIGREPEFDAFTDAASRAIAARFAPASARSMPDARSQTSAAPTKVRVNGGQKVSATAKGDSGWRRPSLDHLRRHVSGKPGPELSAPALRAAASMLEAALADFGVKGEVKAISPGPVVTLYEFEPARGVKSSRVISLADDIARSMSLASVRAAIVPGRNAIGFELPNARREPVLLRDLLEADAYQSADTVLPMALGRNISGAPIIADLARMPHLLVAGTTGSGKSVGINAMVLSLLYRCSPDDCRLLMIDPKMLELSVYNGIPHLLTPVVTDSHKAIAALNWAVSEMEERYKRMAALAVRNIDVFNNRIRNAKKRGEALSRTVQTGFDAAGQAVYENQKIELVALPRIVIVVDEFADLMMVAGKEVEAAVQRLAQMARAAGIHLIMATQRPSVDVLTGTIKANFPTRISFKVTSKIDSRTILNEQGAEQLLGHGDMLYSPGAGQVMRVHGAFVADEEVEAVADALRQQRAPHYVSGILDAAAFNDEAGGVREVGDGNLYDRAVAIVTRDRKASTSYLQRRLSIGYNRAADLIERMERGGLITSANAVGKREILMPASGANAA